MALRLSFYLRVGTLSALLRRWILGRFRTRPFVRAECAFMTCMRYTSSFSDFLGRGSSAIHGTIKGKRGRGRINSPHNEASQVVIAMVSARRPAPDMLLQGLCPKTRSASASPCSRRHNSRCLVVSSHSAGKDDSTISLAVSNICEAMKTRSDPLIAAKRSRRMASIFGDVSIGIIGHPRLVVRVVRLSPSALPIAPSRRCRVVR